MFDSESISDATEDDTDDFGDYEDQGSSSKDVSSGLGRTPTDTPLVCILECYRTIYENYTHPIYVRNCLL